MSVVVYDAVVVVMTLSRRVGAVSRWRNSCGGSDAEVVAHGLETRPREVWPLPKINMWRHFPSLQPHVLAGGTVAIARALFGRLGVFLAVHVEHLYTNATYWCKMRRFYMEGRYAVWYLIFLPPSQDNHGRRALQKSMNNRHSL